MNLDEAYEVVRAFERAGVSVILIGGVAMQLQGVGATADVDLLLTVRGFKGLGDKLSKDTSISGFRARDQVATWVVRVKGRLVRFDALDPAFFSGTKTGDAFYDYVSRRWSYRSKIGPSVTPAVVWYMRLLVPGESYLDRILRDIDEGAQMEWLDQALCIATHFGTQARVRGQLRKLTQLGLLTGTIGGKHPPELR